MPFDFGDITEEDVYASEGAPAPEQVAIRLHEEQEDLQSLRSKLLTPWQDLSEEEQRVAYDIAAALIQRIAEDRNAGSLALWLHELRESIDPQVPPWNQLSESEQAVAHVLLVLILTWLYRQGTVR